LKILDDKDKYEDKTITVSGSTSPENPYKTISGGDEDFTIPYIITVGDEKFVMSNPNGLRVEGGITGKDALYYNDPKNPAIKGINDIYNLQFNTDSQLEYELPNGNMSIKYINEAEAGTTGRPGYYFTLPGSTDVYYTNSATDIWNSIMATNTAQ